MKSNNSPSKLSTSSSLLITTMQLLHRCIKLMRPHQWLKNSFVLVGVLFSYTKVSETQCLDALLAFMAFCCAASSVYIFNDLLDAKADRLHPKKRLRPIAANLISMRVAATLLLLLLATVGIISISASARVLIFISCYLLINIAYTLRLKNIVIVDVFCISAGFMLRLLAGTIAIGIPPSRWLLITGMLITLLLGFGKRRAELATSDGLRTRKILEFYSLPLLDMFITICAAGTLITYGLYTVDPSTVLLHRTEALIWTTPVITFGIFRYLYLIHIFGKGEDTSKDLFKDIPMVLTASFWFALVITITQSA